MNLGIINNLIGGIGSAVGNATEKIGGVINKGTEIRKGNQENRELRAHELEMAQVQSYISELQITGGWIDTIGRIPRPLIAFLVIIFLVMFCVAPDVAGRVAVNMQKIPSDLWYIIMGVIGFYFTFRTVDKAMDDRKKLSAEELQGIQSAIETKHSAAVKRIEDAHTATMAALIDANGDGLDDRGIEQLKIHEGYREKPYKCTAGKMTIGYGTNLDAGIDEAEAEFLLAYRMKKIISEIKKALPWVESLDTARAWVLYNMGYNLGTAGLLAFKNTLKSVESGDYKKASKQMQDSTWFKQVGGRARELCKQMESGKFA